MVYRIRGGRIERITLDGTITGYALPNAASEPNGITAGPDGALWFTEQLGEAIGRISVSGGITEYPFSANSNAGPIAAGPDGALWFAEIGTDKIGRITTSGQITEFAVPSPKSFPWGITTGPDGALWFSETCGSKVARITTSGVISEYALPAGVKGPQAMTQWNGSLWFLFQGGVGEIKTNGAVTAYTVPGVDTNSINAISVGPDNALWFTERSRNAIGRLTFNET